MLQAVVSNFVTAEDLDAFLEFNAGRDAFQIKELWDLREQLQQPRAEAKASKADTDVHYGHL